MSTSKQTILAAIRALDRPPAPPPELTGPWIEYPDRLAQFTTVLESIGARVHRAPTIEAANELLLGLRPFAEARRGVSHVPGLGLANVDLAAIDDPHALENVDVAVMPGEFGVAENGAIWVTSRGVRHRAIYIIVQHLALVIPVGELVSNMHEAYARIRPAEAPWGAFLAGPSKTADIEQSLVIGAHGPRSLDVFCIG